MNREIIHRLRKKPLSEGCFMTKVAFHALMVHPRTGNRLSDMLADNACVDAERSAEDDARQRERNDAIYTRAIRAWFRETEGMREWR